MVSSVANTSKFKHFIKIFPLQNNKIKNMTKEANDCKITDIYFEIKALVGNESLEIEFIKPTHQKILPKINAVGINT